VRPKSKKDAAPGNFKGIRDIRVRPGESKVLLTRDDHFPGKVYYYFSSQSTPGSLPFYYTCHPCHLPGHVRADVFIGFMCRLLGIPRNQRLHLKRSLPAHNAKKYLHCLDEAEKGMILLALMRNLKDKKGFFLVNNIQGGLPFEFAFQLKEFMDDMEKSGSAILYLTDKPVAGDARFLSHNEFEEITGWKKTVELIQNALEKQDREKV
jgi:hypothetical protein